MQIIINFPEEKWEIMQEGAYIPSLLDKDVYDEIKNGTPFPPNWQKEAYEQIYSIEAARKER